MTEDFRKAQAQARDLGAQIKKIIQEANVPKKALADMVGIPKGSVFGYENDLCSVGNTEALLKLMQELGPAGIRKKYEESVDVPKEQDTAERVKAEVEKTNIRRRQKRHMRGRTDTGLAKEIRAFQRKHDMSYSDLEDLFKVSRSTVRHWLVNGFLPPVSTVEAVRKAMYDYDHEPVSVTPAPNSAPKTSPAPASEPAAAPHTIEEKAARLKSITVHKMEGSVRLVNALVHAHYRNLYEVACRTQAELMRVKGMGRKCLRELEEILDEEGVTLRKTSYRHKEGSVPVAGALVDRPEETLERKNPPVKPPPAPAPTPPAPKPCPPSIKLITSNGVRLNDGDNVAPHLKIDGATRNARAWLDLQERTGSFADWVWAFAPDPGRPAPVTLADVPARTPESDALSKALKQAGFTFVGSTIVYAFMQSAGLVDDHLADCPARGHGR